MRSGVGRCGRSVPVGGEEFGQCRDRLVRSLLGKPVADAGNDQDLHVARDELHRVRGHGTRAFLSAHRQDGHRQPAGLSLPVLRRGGAERTVELEAAVQRLRAGGQAVDVVLRGVPGQVVVPAEAENSTPKNPSATETAPGPSGAGRPVDDELIAIPFRQVVPLTIAQQVGSSRP